MPGELRLDEPTRAGRLSWVIAVGAALPAGLSVNAAAWLVGPGGGGRRPGVAPPAVA